MNLYERKLSNGIQVKILRLKFNPDRKIFRRILIVGTGAADDPKAKSGMAHTAEHIIMARLGGSVGSKRSRGILRRARTHLDYTEYDSRALERDWAQTISRDFECLSAPHISGKEAGEAVSAVIAEKKRIITSNSFVRAYDYLYALAYPNHPYQNYTIGNPRDLKGVTREDCQRFFNLHYRPENYRFFYIIGRTSSMTISDIFKQIEQTIGKFRPSPTRGQIPPIRKHSAPASLKEIQFKLSSSTGAPPTLAVGCRLMPESECYRPSLFIMHQLLAQKICRRLDMPLHSVGGHFPLTVYEGLYEVFYRAPQGSSRTWGPRAFEAYLSACDDVVSGNISRSEMNNAVKGAQEEVRLSAASAAIGLNMLIYDLLGRCTFDPSKHRDEIQRMTADKISAFATQLLRPSRMTAVYLC